jgi:hypothetical protein
MALFKPAEMTSSYLKAAFLGFAGDGKTFTATELGGGLVQHMRKLKLEVADRPVLFLDTEKGSDWVKPRFDKMGIQLMVAKTQAFDDGCAAIREAEKAASVLIIDSVSHLWKELCQSYMKKMGRNRLTMGDWGYLKQRWSEGFTTPFVNAKAHIILCGRAGFEYDHEEDDDGKKQIVKSGVKMKAEGEMGYEPDLVVLMEREHDAKDITKVNRVAHILKDRADVIDERKFPNPSFKDFLPHIERLNLGGKHVGTDQTRTSMASMPAHESDKRATQRAICLDEIESLMIEHIPGQAAADKSRKIQLIKKHFNAGWVEMERVMPLESLRCGYDSLHMELTGEPSRYAAKPSPTLPPLSDDDYIPDFPKLEPLAPAAPANEADAISVMQAAE